MLLPPIEGLLSYTDFAHQIRNRQAHLCLLQYRDDLLN